MTKTIKKKEKNQTINSTLMIFTGTFITIQIIRNYKIFIIQNQDIAIAAIIAIIYFIIKRKEEKENNKNDNDRPSKQNN